MWNRDKKLSCEYSNINSFLTLYSKLGILFGKVPKQSWTEIIGLKFSYLA